MALGRFRRLACRTVGPEFRILEVDAGRPHSRERTSSDEPLLRLTYVNQAGLTEADFGVAAVRDRDAGQGKIVGNPPGTSKWNRIEHRMFSYISINWRAKPLTSYRS